MMDDAKVAAELSKLKDFQRRTAEHVFQRLYLDKPPAQRFLVADEVGLGKTMVARGVVAQAIHHLQADRRVDIIYICSNAAIAAQNLRRLNVLDEDSDVRFATRLTLLPTQLTELDANPVNFISFTPGTTFELGLRAGTKEERALLRRMLEGQWGLKRTPLHNLLRVNAGDAGWENAVDACRHAALDARIVESFRARLAASPTLAQLTELCLRFARKADNVPREVAESRAQVVGARRQILASVCVEALEPDLVILDEFQRFKDILHGESDAALLARQLFEFKDVRTLLLSATPYRMLTLGDDEDDDHHRDFLDTVGFLANDGETTVGRLRSALGNFRQSLFQTGPDQLQRVEGLRHEVEGVLRQTMCRTERVATTLERDAMLKEVPIHAALCAADIDQAVAVDRVSQLLGAGDAVEYWKSAPYLLSFMEAYELKKRLLAVTPKATECVDAVAAHAPFLLQKKQFEAYEQVDPGNARLRALIAETLDTGNARLLWLPPAVPYIAPSGPYANLDARAATKTLVFSSWHVVPKAVAVLLSYEAERRMLGAHIGDASHSEMVARHTPLLAFKMEGDKPRGMPALALLYPCATLAAHVDPLDVALTLGKGQPASLGQFRSFISERVQRLVGKLVAKYAPAQDGAVDQRWYWAVPALLDQQHSQSAITWLSSDAGFRGIFSSEDDDEQDAAVAREEGETTSGFQKHVDALLDVLRGDERLGRVPDDLGSVIADFALASPAVCAARALLRVSHLSSAWDPHVLSAAAQVAKGFRVLFNVAETSLMLRGEDEHEPYWRRVLEYCVDGNLQSVLDEYAHQLVENKGCIGKSGKVIVEKLSEAMLSALTPRAANLRVDEVAIKSGRPAVNTFTVRCRYALRFGEVRDEAGGTPMRAETTREAFNSPFRPFVLASTSVGQEGLDFHSYCHAVYHWNLPTNPVDLEQREGRVHRYKGHAVRRNIGLKYGLHALHTRWKGDGDPWERLFELAAADRKPGANELVPYWIFETEGGVRVERRVPLLPMSREIALLAKLKRQLALYRLAFGQPRQEDLLAYLSARELPEGALDAWRVSLEPPALVLHVRPRG